MVPRLYSWFFNIFDETSHLFTNSLHCVHYLVLKKQKYKGFIGKCFSLVTFSDICYLVGCREVELVGILKIEWKITSFCPQLSTEDWDTFWTSWSVWLFVLSNLRHCPDTLGYRKIWRMSSHIHGRDTSWVQPCESLSLLHDRFVEFWSWTWGYVCATA